MLELLKGAAQVAHRTESEAVPPGLLSFTLEYDRSPDPEAERARIEALLEGGGFDLFPYSREDDPELLILQFPGLEAEQSPDFLMEVAQDLRDALDIASVTPEIRPPYRDVLAMPPMTEGLGDVIWAICTSKAASPGDPDWARKLMRVDRAEARFGVDGKGILVAQPDTGVADHVEIQSGIDQAKGWDFVANRPGPVDPLSAKMGSPGHGTATSSLVASRRSHVVTGSATGATLVPVRAVNSVIIGQGVSVAKAVDHARKAGCRVITMSLGGPIAGRALARALARAAAADMIVLAAAGNCVGQVTYPAWDRNVIAVAGVDEHGKRWKGSSRGSAVDIAAPAENVHVARRVALAGGQQPDLSLIDRQGQGTSYATALTAGVAALWLQHFGPDAVRTEARKRGQVVQELFRAALRHSARVPAGWDHANMGAGIVDAEKLLDTPLASVPAGPGPRNESPALAAFGQDFEGTRFEAEASFVAFDWLMRDRAESVPVVETPLPARPSPQFAAQIDRTPPGGQPAPALILSPKTPPVPIDDALKRLAVGRSGKLESAGEIGFDDALERVRTEGTDSILDTAKGAFDARARAEAGRVDTGIQAEALRRMDAALSTLAAPDRPGAMPADETRVVLEALVKLTGRPAIRVRGDGSEVLDPLLGDWQGDLVPTRAKWQKLTDAVGRIDVKTADGWVHAGTGFIIVDGAVMTNRHVLDTFAEPIPSTSGQPTFLMRREASIIFDAGAADETTRYSISGVITAGKNRIGRFVNLGSLDMAVLAMSADNGHGPPPPAIDRATVSLTDPAVRKLLVAGYPAKPSAAQAPDAAGDAAQFLAFWDRIEELYGDTYGVKYMSPGLVMARPGEVAGDPKHWVFTHDATTLPGNSGSAIISLDGATQFCGLHFGGETLTQNLAHDIASVFATGDGVFSTAFLG